MLPLDGGGIAGPSAVSRTFIIDPLAPVVTKSNIRYFDHLTPNEPRNHNQYFRPTCSSIRCYTNALGGMGTITMETVSPTGEYITRPISNPSDLDANFGDYISIIDDSSAFPEKVAGYVTGMTHQVPLVGGGSDMVDDHLFMYQISVMVVR